MTPQEQEHFDRALSALMVAATEGYERDGQTIRLRDSEFRAGVMYLWLAREANGYLNIPHVDAQAICSTDKNSTIRAYLIRLRNAGVLSEYSTNGTVRMKFAAYPGRELITHSRKVLPTVTKSRSTVTNDADEEDDCYPTSRLCDPTSRDRAAGSLLRAVPSRPSRNFDQSEPSKLVSKLDLNTPPKLGANELTATPSTTIDPVEEALSVTFLLAAGFWPKTAKQLAKIHPFETLRRAVSFWWCNRRSRGGEFDERPGIVISWLTNPDETTIPEKLSPEFLASDLYLNHRRKSEMVTTPEIEIDQVEESDEQPTQWPEMNEYWAVALERMREALPAGTFNAWLEGSRAEFGDKEYTCTVIVDSATKRDYLQANLRQMISREVNKSTGYKLTLSFELRRRS